MKSIKLYRFTGVFLGVLIGSLAFESLKSHAYEKGTEMLPLDKLQISIMEGSRNMASCDAFEKALRKGQRTSSKLEVSHQPTTKNLSRMTLEYIYQMYITTDKETLTKVTDELNLIYHYQQLPPWQRLIYNKPINLQPENPERILPLIADISINYPGVTRNCLPKSFTNILLKRWQNDEALQATYHKILTDIKINAINGDKTAETILKGWASILPPPEKYVEDEDPFSGP